MTRRTWMVFPLLVLVAAAPAAAVSVDYDKSKDFSHYKTFAWRDGSPAASELNEERIRLAVSNKLEAAGMTRVEGEADLYVVSHVSIEGRTYVDVDTVGYGGYWRGYTSSVVHVQDVDTGTLVVDLLDGKTERLVWRGLAQKTLPDKSRRGGEKAEKMINKVVDKLFRNYPPES